MFILFLIKIDLMLKAFKGYYTLTKWLSSKASTISFGFKYLLLNNVQVIQFNDYIQYNTHISHSRICLSYLKCFSRQNEIFPSFFFLFWIIIISEFLRKQCLLITQLTVYALSLRYYINNYRVCIQQFRQHTVLYG